METVIKIIPLALILIFLTSIVSSVGKKERIKPISEPKCPPPIAPKNLTRRSKTQWTRINLTLPGKVNHCDVIGINLQRVNIESTSFLNFLRKCKNLKFINLHQTKFLTPMDNRQVHLPALVEFSMYGCSIPAQSPQLTKEQLQNDLFFDKGTHWGIEEITQLGVDIEINCGENTYFQVNKGIKKLLSNLAYTNEILQNLKQFEPEIMDLRHCAVKVELIPNSLTNLKLRAVTLLDGDLSDVASKCAELASLVVWNSGDSPNYFLYLADLKGKLKSLELKNTELRYNPRQFDLDNMTLTTCIIDKDIIKDFSRIFNAVTIHVECRDTRQMHPLLFEMLRMTKLENIWMRNFQRNESQLSHYLEMESFLSKAGVPENRDWFHIVKVNGEWAAPPSTGVFSK